MAVNMRSVSVTGRATVGQPAGSDAYFSSVVLLLGGAGTHGSDVIVDSSSYARVPDTVLSVQYSNEQAKFGTTSIKSMSSTAILNYASSINFERTNTWTVEWFVYFSAISENRYLLGRSATSYMTTSLTAINSTNWSSGSDSIGADVITEGAWHHIAFSQDGTTMRAFMDGVVTGTVTPGDTASGAEPLGIFNVPGRTDLLTIEGYIAELRYTQGVCRYVGAFTPPTAPFPTF